MSDFLINLFGFIFLMIFSIFIEKKFVRWAVIQNIDLFYALYRDDIIRTLKKEGKINDL